MTYLTKPLIILFRILAPVLVILGIGFWTGHWAGLIPLHRFLGIAFVLTLWAIAVAALTNGNPQRRLAVFAIVWGFVVAVLGMTQQRILVGDLHWIVRVLHLATAIVAMHIAGKLTAPSREAAPA
ncbi:MAG TPA: hypothetical protein VIP11_01890 [Gemmatimonadaceae bacterium]